VDSLASGYSLVEWDDGTMTIESTTRLINHAMLKAIVKHGPKLHKRGAGK